MPGLEETDHSMDDSETIDPNSSHDDRNVLDDGLLLKLLDEDIDNEETLCSLVENENIAHSVLNKALMNDGRFDFLFGLTNLTRRLSRIDDDVINRWLGLDCEADTEIICFVSFVFNILDQYYERLCFAQMIQFSDLFFSLYDYLCSVMGSFIMTLNEEQISVVEDILFENLFSPVLVKALLSADILCLMCRTSKSSYSYDICHVLISLLNQIYLEDAEITDKESEFAYSSFQLTQEILIHLCNRIMTFLSSSEINLLKESFPVSEFLFLWKRFNCRLLNFTAISVHHFVFDNLVALTKLPKQTVSNLLVDRFAETVTADEYQRTLQLSLLGNIKFQLNYDQHRQVLEKIHSIFAQPIGEQFKCQYLLKTLKILNSLSFVRESRYQDKTFQNDLKELLLILFEECDLNFITKLYFYSTLLNIANNRLFANTISSLSFRFGLKKEFKLLLKYKSKGKFMTNDEREIYITQKLKPSYDSIDYRQLVLSDEDLKFQFVTDNLLIVSSSDSSQQSFDKNNSDTNSLVEHFQALLDKLFKHTNGISEEKKAKLLSLAESLTTHINQLEVL